MNNSSVIVPCIKLSSSYVIDCKEKEKLKKELLRKIRSKKLPKGLEVSVVEELLKNIKYMPEHEYSRKYDTSY